LGLDLKTSVDILVLMARYMEELFFIGNLQTPLHK